jgi:hypothetical protein
MKRRRSAFGVWGSAFTKSALALRESNSPETQTNRALYELSMSLIQYAGWQPLNAKRRALNAECRAPNAKCI